jgi:hypothetical protein
VSTNSNCTSSLVSLAHSTGHKVLLPADTGVADLPAMAGDAMAAGRVKHVAIEDLPSLLAALQLLLATVSEKHVLLVLHSLTPVLMTQKVVFSTLAATASLNTRQL